jgi:hypothetical protein
MSHLKSFGQNLHAQTQPTEASGAIYEPTSLNDIIPWRIQSVRCSANATLILTEDGCAYGMSTGSAGDHLFGIPRELLENQLDSESHLVFAKSVKEAPVTDFVPEQDDLVRIPFFTNPPKLSYTATYVSMHAEEYDADDELQFLSYEETETMLGNGLFRIPQWLFNNERIKHIDICERFSLYVTESNRIFALGQYISNATLFGIPINLNIVSTEDMQELYESYTNESVPIGKLLRPPILSMYTKSSYTTLPWWNVHQIHIVRGTSMLDIFVLLKDGSLYACGENGMNQLGLPNTSSVLSITLVPTHDLYIKHVTMGNHFSLFLTRDGLVYGCGNSKSNQLNAMHSQNSHKLVHILFNERISMIASFGDRSVAVAGNAIYLWGWDVRIMKPIMMKKFTLNEKVSSIDMGYSHIIVTTTDSNVYCMGYNTRGALGLDPTVQQVKNFVQVTAQASHVACGEYHTILYNRCVLDADSRDIRRLHMRLRQFARGEHRNFHDIKVLVSTLQL